MLVLSLLQAAADVAKPPSSDVMSHAVEAVVLGVLLALGRWLNKRNGRAKDAATHKALREIRDDISELSGIVKDLTAHLIGPDGKNGLRSRTENLEADMDELKRRGHFTTPPDRPHLDPRDVGAFDRRAGTR